MLTSSIGAAHPAGEWKRSSRETAHSASSMERHSPGAGIIFFANGSTPSPGGARSEDPQRDLRRILASLAVCTVLFVATAWAHGITRIRGSTLLRQSRSQ